MLPGLAQQHFRKTGDAFDYEVAVVSSAGRGVVYHSAAGFSPKPDAQADAAVDLFQVRTQDFGAVAAEVRRFATTFTAKPAAPPVPEPSARITARSDHRSRRCRAMPGRRGRSRPASPVQRVDRRPQDTTAGPDAPGVRTATWRMTSPSAPRWRLLVKHPSGSLEAAVNAVRRRNLLVSSSILGGARGQRRPADSLDAPRAGAGAPADGVRRRRLARAAHAARRHPIGRRQPRRRRRPRRRADPQVRRSRAERRAAADGDGRADPRVRRHPVGAARRSRCGPSRSRRCCTRSWQSSRALDRRGRDAGRVRHRRTALPPVARRRAGAAPRVSEPDRQRHQVRRGRRAGLGLRARHVGREVHVTVADRGIGIAAVGAAAHLRAVLPHAGRRRGADPGRRPRPQPRQADRRGARRARHAAERAGRGQRRSPSRCRRPPKSPSPQAALGAVASRRTGHGSHA